MPETKWIGLRKPLGVLKATAVDTGTDSTIVVSPEEAAGIMPGDKLKLYSVDGFVHTLLGDRVTVTDITDGEGVSTITFDPPVGSSTATGNEAYALEVVDVETWVSEQMEKLDTIPGCVMVDENFPIDPADLKSGVIGFDVESKELLVWGSEEQRWFVWNAPYYTKGSIVHWHVDTAGETVGLNQTSLYFSTTVDFPPNRVCIVEFSVNVELVSGTAAEGFLCVRVADGDTVTTSDELLGRFPLDLPPVGTGNSLNYTGQCLLFTLEGGTATVGFFVERTGMTGTANSMRLAADSYNTFSIEDAGTDEAWRL